MPQEPALPGPGRDRDPSGPLTGFPELGSPQWRLVPCRPDRDEAYLVGQMGVMALLAGENDKMVTLVRHDQPVYHCTSGLVDLAQVANVQRLLPDEYLDANKTMVTQSFYDYALPLIGEPLPQYRRLETTRLTKR